MKPRKITIVINHRNDVRSAILATMEPYDPKIWVLSPVLVRICNTLQAPVSDAIWRASDFAADQVFNEIG